MSLDVEQRIRDRAYAIWLEQGCPEGCDYEHWLLAEQEVAGASDAPEDAPKAAAKKAADKPVAERKPRVRKAVVAV